MVLALGSKRKAPASGLSAWGSLIWLILLLAALGCLQYVNHGLSVWHQLQSMPASEADAIGSLRMMLAWDGVYLLAAFAVIVVCAGCVLRQEWARRGMRIVALILAIWALVTAVLMIAQWQSFDQARHLAALQAQGSAAMQDMVAQAQRSYLTAVTLKIIAVPVLLWLAWRLARLDVRAAFHARRLNKTNG